MRMKKCKDCGQTLSSDNFYTNYSCPDGLNTYCKPCARDRSKKYNAAHKQERAVYYKEWQEDNEPRVQSYKTQWRRENREACLARQILRKAIYEGRLTRPNVCEECGKSCRPLGHHEDYSKPLEITWLCDICHGKRRRTCA